MKEIDILWKLWIQSQYSNLEIVELLGLQLLQASWFRLLFVLIIIPRCEYNFDNTSINSQHEGRSMCHGTRSPGCTRHFNTCVTKHWSSLKYVKGSFDSLFSWKIPLFRQESCKTRNYMILPQRTRFFMLASPPKQNFSIFTHLT
jgi:hypothetical protein